ncbi:MAG: STAS domain-containing protein [Blastocatellia bacterium]|nr:STAS domain-containing protein [Blastocatellia bacterium]
MADVFKVTTRMEGKYAILYTEGYINNLAGDKIVEEFNQLVAKDVKHYVLNLQKTQLVNSIGISILIEVIEKVQEIGGTLAFCHLTPIIAKTFKIMGLTQYSKVYDTEEDALKN